MFSVDLLESLDVLVTGSADSTVKLWKLTTGQLMTTLTQHRSSWITHVFLFYTEILDRRAENPSTSCQGITSTSNNTHHRHQPSSTTVLSDIIKVQPDNPSTSVKQASGDVNQEKTLSSQTEQKFYILSQDNMSLHLWEVRTKNGQHTIQSSEEWQNNTGMALLPGLWKHSEAEGLGFYIAFADGSAVHVYECVGCNSVEGVGVTGITLSAIKKLRDCQLPEGLYPQVRLSCQNNQFFTVSYEKVFVFTSRNSYKDKYQVFRGLLSLKFILLSGNFV